MSRTEIEKTFELFEEPPEDEDEYKEFLMELQEEMLTDAYVEISAVSDNGKFSLEELVHVIYYGNRIYKDFNNECIYEMMVQDNEDGRKTLTYNCNT